jgi:hypothetical protein
VHHNKPGIANNSAMVSSPQTAQSIKKKMPGKKRDVLYLWTDPFKTNSETCVCAGFAIGSPSSPWRLSATSDQLGASWVITALSTMWIYFI